MEINGIFERYRNMQVAKEEDGTLVVYVRTRTGGGNREEYQENIDEVRAHKYYMEDSDDDFDSTYMWYTFKIPHVHVKQIETLWRTPKGALVKSAK